MTNPTPSLPAELEAATPKLADAQLLAELRAHHTRLFVWAEQLDHLRVSQGVADAVHGAHESLAVAYALQAQLMLGSPS